MTDNDKNINDVYNYWNNRPCNINHSNKELCSKEYFEEVTKIKYFVDDNFLLYFSLFYRCGW